MRNRINNYLRGFSAVCSDMVIACLVLALLPLITKQEIQIPLMIWLCVLGMQLAVNEIMLTIGAPWNLYFIFNGAAVAAAGFLVLWLAEGAEWPGLAPVVILAAVGPVGVHGAVVGRRLPGSNVLSVYVDTLIVALAFYLYSAFDTGWKEDMRLVLVALAAMALDLIVVNHLRTGDECEQVIYGSGAGGRMILFLIMAACMLVTGLVAGLVSGQIHNVVDLFVAVLKWCASIVAAVLGFFGGIIGGILNYLMSLLPDAEPVAGAPKTAVMEEITGEAAQTTASGLPEWVGILILCLAAVAAIGAIMYRFRGVKVGRQLSAGRAVKSVRKSHVLSSFRSRIQRRWQKLCFEWNYWRFRKTPEGLLILAERSCHSRKLQRQVHESPGEFIRRLDGILREREPDAVGLEELAEMMDERFYGNDRCRLSAEQYRNFAGLLHRVNVKSV